MSVYTKGGDKGKTGLYALKRGKDLRVSKDSLVICAIGAVDEANSYLGVVLSKVNKKYKYGKSLIGIQKNLFTIAAALAGAKLSLNSLDVKALEREIDNIEGRLPVLANFVLPGGTQVSSSLMFARALVRRAEREIVKLVKRKKIKQMENIFMYVNRLSDFLFILAREDNFRNRVKEQIWKKEE